ncbi:MAG: F0F1 ATP synthase subunit epsilon, partial [Acholeplasmatales bacterium]|nr:F0F1 ATP synthase subunit epsilon [Acholeplasmatales bacterium]
MKISVSTHQGKLYDDEITYAVIKNADGEFAIMKNHVPLVCVIP